MKKAEKDREGDKIAQICVLMLFIAIIFDALNVPSFLGL